MTAAADDLVGYGKPPRSSRFPEGQSGNPKGRPRNHTREIPHDAVLGQMVTVREDGRERRVTAAEAFLLQLTQKGLAGDSAAARSSLEAIEKARTARGVAVETVDTVILKPISSGADAILDTLDIARLQFPTDEKRVRWSLSPWVVEAALTRLAGRRLSIAEQREVFANTRTPNKVAWPEWWSHS